jgi:hypothetical protein
MSFSLRSDRCARPVGRSARVSGTKALRRGKIEPDSSGEMADGDPVTPTSPVKNGNRCQFLLQYTSFARPSREMFIVALTTNLHALAQGADSASRLRDGVVRNLPAEFAGATFHPPVVPARAVPNLQDGPEGSRIARVTVLALARVAEGRRVIGGRAEHDGRRAPPRRPRTRFPRRAAPHPHAPRLRLRRPHR